VVSGQGGPRENIDPDASGLVCGEAGGEGWAARLAPLVQSSERREAMGRLARRYAETRRWEAALAPLYQTYRELAHTSAGVLTVAPMTVCRT
jgi:hypothetical protein